MKRRFQFVTLAATLLAIVLLLSVGGVAAQSSPQASVGTAFTYQGQLRGGNAPGTGTCDMGFQLSSVASGNNPASSPITLTVPITNNLFTVQLDFGASPFVGEARWLEVRVKCGSDTGFTTLAPRQALTAAPYALGLMPNATINGLNNTGNLSFGNVTRQMLNLWGTEYGIGVQSYTVYNRTDYGGGFAWYEGGTHSNTQNDPGPSGNTQMRLNSSNGLRVSGKVSASTNAVSPGAAVSGTNTGSGYGVYGTSASGGGVIGESSTGNGVIGNTSGIASAGVIGTSYSNGPGVWGETAAIGCDINVPATPKSPTQTDPLSLCAGIYGKAQGNVSTGIVGIGLYGAAGIRGKGDGVGVIGESTYFAGVFGESTNAPGVLGKSNTNNGIAGHSSSSASSGVYGENLAAGNGVAGRANGAGTGVLGDNTNTSGYAGYFNGRLHVEGNLEFTGNLVGGNKSGYVSDIAVNAGGDVLTPGDVVVVIGHSAPVVGTIPVARVIKASAAYQTGVVGIVDQHVTRGAGVRFDDGPISPDEYLNVVTLGMYRLVKVDANYGAIHAGDLLVAAPHAGYAMKATDRFQAVGAIIGKALGDLHGGTGTLPVIVTLQ